MDFTDYIILGISNVKKVQQRTLNNPLYLHTEITLHFPQLHQYLSQADSQKCVLQ